MFIEASRNELFICIAVWLHFIHHLLSYCFMMGLCVIKINRYAPGKKIPISNNIYYLNIDCISSIWTGGFSLRAVCIVLVHDVLLSLKILVFSCFSFAEFLYSIFKIVSILSCSKLSKLCLRVSKVVLVLINSALHTLMDSSMSFPDVVSRISFTLSCFSLHEFSISV